MYPEDTSQQEVRYISPRTMNDVKKRLAIIDMLEMQLGDVRTSMLHAIAADTHIDIATESWGIDLDHGCVIKQAVPPADAAQDAPVTPAPTTIPQE